MKYNWKRVLSVCLALMLLVSTGKIAYATSLTNDSIKQKEEDIKKAQDEKKVLQQGLSDVQKLVKELEESKDDLSDYVTKLDGKLTSIQSKIDELQGLIDTKETEIETTTTQLNEAIATEKAQYEAMKMRIKFMYEHGQTFYLEMLLSAKSFGDILNKADYIEQLSQYDREQLLSYQQTRQEIADCKTLLEEQKATLAEAQKVMQNEQSSVQTLITEKEKEIQAYENDITNKEAAIKEYEAEIAAQNAEIAELERQVAEEKQRLAAENKTAIIYDGGKFKWPAPAYTRISDDYGYRIHPTLHVKQFHNGIDMAAPGGSPILAAYDGEVVAAAYNASMGNYVMIDHGGGLYTIYMHASALYVSKGQVVVKGQKIAAVGTTGRSTGNHLHFSVRLNGSYVNPWNYLSS